MITKKKCDNEVFDSFESGFKVAKVTLKKRWKLAFVCAKFSVLNPGLKREKNFERSGISMKFENSQKDLRTLASIVAKEHFEEIVKLSIFKNYHTSIKNLTCVLFEKNMTCIKTLINYSTYQGEVVLGFFKVAGKIYFSNQIKKKSFKSFLKNNKKLLKIFKKQIKVASTIFKNFCCCL